MAKNTTYKQCRLKHVDGRIDTRWIPSQFAVVGKSLGIDRPDGTREEGWQVQTASAEMAAEYVESHERDYAKTRSATDI